MTPFAIAGIQMPVSANDENLSSMGRRLDDGWSGWRDVEHSAAGT